MELGQLCTVSSLQRSQGVRPLFKFGGFLSILGLTLTLPRLSLKVRGLNGAGCDVFAGAAGAGAGALVAGAECFGAEAGAGEAVGFAGGCF